MVTMERRLGVVPLVMGLLPLLRSEDLLGILLEILDRRDCLVSFEREMLRMLRRYPSCILGIPDDLRLRL